VLVTRIVTQAATVVGAVSVASGAWPTPARAHGLVGRADLPVPTEVFVAAAAAVLVLSFLALGAAWSSPRLETTSTRRLFALPRAVDVVLGAFGIACFAALVYAGLWGEQVQRDNLTPTLVYVCLWVGVPFASLLLGDVFRLISPGARWPGRWAGWPPGSGATGCRLPRPIRGGWAAGRRRSACCCSPCASWPGAPGRSPTRSRSSRWSTWSSSWSA